MSCNPSARQNPLHLNDLQPRHGVASLTLTSSAYFWALEAAAPAARTMLAGSTKANVQHVSRPNVEIP